MQIRMYIRLAVIVSLVALMVVLIVKTGGDEDRGPRYTLEAFKRHWTVHSPNPKSHFSTPSEVEGGYAVDYGDGVSLFIIMHKDTVMGVRIRYDTSQDRGMGGPRFLLLMQTAINVGVFRWPQERIEQVRHVFAHISPQPKTYRYHYTSFTRTHERADRWEFAMEFVPNKPEEDTGMQSQQTNTQ